MKGVLAYGLNQRIMATSEQVAVLPLNISRGLTDKLVEKRKGAALELEKCVLHFLDPFF